VKPTGKYRQLPSLSTKLLLLSGLISLLLSVSFTWLNTHNQQTELRDVFTKQATALAFNLAVSSTSHLLEKDLAVIEQLLLETNSFQDLYSATVTDREGHVLAEVIRHSTDNQLRTQHHAERLVFSGNQTGGTHLYVNGRLLTVMEPIGAPRTIGHVVLEYDLYTLHQRENQLIERNIALAAILITLAGLCLWLFIRGSLKELNQVTEFAQGIATHEGSQLHVSSSSRELSLLQETLNWTSHTLAVRNRNLTLAKQKADKSNELKSQFVANMSHEIRTPLNGILGITDISLNNTGIDSKTRDNLQLIRHSAEHLLRVVNDILDFSKIDADKLEIEPHPFTLKKALQATFDTVCKAYAKDNVKCALNIAQDLPDHFIGDLTRILQVINNLLSNALKFSNRGEVSLTVSLKGFEEHNDPALATLRFVVKDTGIGISQQAHDEIFKAFSQAEPGTARKYGGTGLGLTITQRLLGLMGSQIHLNSTEGVGSEFSFELTLPCPSAPAQSTSHLPTQRFIRQVEAGLEPLIATPAIRALVAEDNMVNQTFIGYVLTQLGVAHQFAQDGEQAIDLVDRYPFDLIFMDMHMPKVGGLQACKTILSKPAHRELSIIGLTADAIADTKTACLQAGMKDYVSKPFKRADIEQALNDLGLMTTPIPLKNFDNDPSVLRASVNKYLNDIAVLRPQIVRPNHQKEKDDSRHALEKLTQIARTVGDLRFAKSVQTLIESLQDDLETPARQWVYLHMNLDVFVNRLESLRCLHGGGHNQLDTPCGVCQTLDFHAGA